MLAWQCAFPLYKESLNPQTWVEHPHDTLKFLLGIQLLLGTPRYTWGNGAHGMLRAADVAVMLLWCLWPMRVVLPGGLTLCQSISTRTILHQCAPTFGPIPLPRYPTKLAFRSFVQLALPSCCQASAGISGQSKRSSSCSVSREVLRGRRHGETRFGQLVLQGVALGQGREQNDGTTGTLAVRPEAPQNSCGDMGDLWTAFRTLVRPASVDHASHVG